MRIGLISDLHIDINKAYPVMDLLAAKCRQEKLDLLVIAGDVSETPAQTIEAVRSLQENLKKDTGCRVYYVPGNHDMWNKNCPDRKTEEIAAAYEADPLCLSGKKAVREGDCLLVGDIGWYDYSFASPAYSRAQLETMQTGGRTWQDKLFNSWTVDNEAAMKASLARLREGLETAKEKMAARETLIAVTHMLPVRDFCVPEEQKDWGFFNAFLGGEAIGDLLREYPVKIAVCGHVHYRSCVERDGIRWICPCLGYHSEWPLYGLADNEAQTHIADALQIMNI